MDSFYSSRSEDAQTNVVHLAYILERQFDCIWIAWDHQMTTPPKQQTILIRIGKKTWRIYSIGMGGW